MGTGEQLVRLEAVKGSPTAREEGLGAELQLMVK